MVGVTKSLPTSAPGNVRVLVVQIPDKEVEADKWEVSRSRHFEQNLQRRKRNSISTVKS